MEKNYSFKEFEKVKLKALDDFMIGSHQVVPGEVIASFDRISIAGLSEIDSRITAHGGFGDRTLVTWENMKEANLVFTQGVFSPTQFALANNAAMKEIQQATPILLTEVEQCEADENGEFEISHDPYRAPLVFDARTGARVEEWAYSGRDFSGLTPFTEYLVHYEYGYANGAKMFCLGQRLYNGFFSLEGWTTFKDDSSGQMLTGILKLSKLRMNAGMSIRLGTQANPNVVNFSATVFPDEPERYFSKYGEFYILNDDLSSDIL